MNVLVLVKAKSGQKYSFIYDDDPRSIEQVFISLGEFASDPDLDFNWYDKAFLADQARELNKAKDGFPNRVR